MDVKLLVNKFSSQATNVSGKNDVNSIAHNRSYGVNGKNLAPLKADTVSFTGYPVSDAVELSIEKLSPRYQRLAVTFLDILESISNQFKDFGFSMNRAYCEEHPVKSAESAVSKIRRSGTFKVPDTIRATVNCQNIYDMTNLQRLIDGMKVRGFVLDTEDMPVKDLIKRGYIPTPKELKILEIQKRLAAGETLEQEDLNFFKSVLDKKVTKKSKTKTQTPEDEVAELTQRIANYKLVKKVPDLDIRLNDVSDQITTLGPELMYSVGKPQKSGYEDIQMRFIRTNDKDNNNPVRFEVIVLMGNNYIKAKSDEYTEVYKYLRDFSKLSVNNMESRPESMHTKKADAYEALIKQMFRDNVSRVMYANAKNKDIAGIEEELPITFAPQDRTLFESYFRGFKKQLVAIFNDLQNGLSRQERKALLDTRNSDLDVVDTMQAGLKKTLDKYIETPAEKA